MILGIYSILRTTIRLIAAIILHLEHQEALEAVERREEQEAEERAEAHELDLFRLKDEYLARTLNLRTRIETLEQQLEKWVFCCLLLLFGLNKLVREMLHSHESIVTALLMFVLEFWTLPLEAGKRVC